VATAASDDAVRWRERARRLAEADIRPLAIEIDRTDTLPASVPTALAREGFFGLGIPAEWGGVGGGTRVVAAVLEELARASAAVAVELAVHLSVCAQPILSSGTEQQKRRYLPALARGELLGAFALSEPGAGSDAGALRTRYRRDGVGFELDGSKMFISNAASAGLVVLFATRDPALGSKGISAFLVPPRNPGVSVAQRLVKLGLRGSETTELVLEHARLDADALLGSEGEGLRIALKALSGGRIGIAACALGVARAAFDEMRRNVRADDADWRRHALARAYTELAAAEAVVAEAAARRDSGAEFVLPASVAKFLASRAAVSIASVGVEVAGAASARAGSEAERLYRDARVFPIVEGTTEIQELIVARRLLEVPDERTLL
jgi:alkylation response protein AidB-like acyl-CoA dehydrogenase